MSSNEWLNVSIENSGIFKIPNLSRVSLSLSLEKMLPLVTTKDFPLAAVSGVCRSVRTGSYARKRTQSLLLLADFFSSKRDVEIP